MVAFLARGLPASEIYRPARAASPIFIAQTQGYRTEPTIEDVAESPPSRRDQEDDPGRPSWSAALMAHLELAGD
jgi:hypothetical protein